MKSTAAVTNAPKTPFSIEELEWEDPIGDEIAVRVSAVGCCHSDWHVANGDYEMDFPNLTGHEGVGIVEKIGSLCKNTKVGDQVAMRFVPSCGHCWFCVRGMTHLCDAGEDIIAGRRPDKSFRVFNKKGQGVGQFCFLGAYSDYTVIPENCAVVIDKEFKAHEVAMVTCRIPTGWGAAVNTAKVWPGATALVVGLGGIGFNVLQGLKTCGASVIIGADIVDKRKWAKEFGVTHYIDSSKQNIVEEVMKNTGTGVDFAFDARGNTKVQGEIVQALNKKGTAVYIGIEGTGNRKIEFSPMDLTLNERQIKGCLFGSCNTGFAIPQLLNLYTAGQIKMKELFTKEYKLTQINEAYADMLAGKNISGVIRMD